MKMLIIYHKRGLGVLNSLLYLTFFLLLSLRSIGEETFAKEVFEEYVVHLQEKAKEKERKGEEEKVCGKLLLCLISLMILLFSRWVKNYKWNDILGFKQPTDLKN